MSTKKEKKENQGAKAPKWGTKEWIIAYPWSKMDKNRRRRVRKVLGLDDELGELVIRQYHIVGSMVEDTQAALKDCGIKLCPQDIKRVRQATNILEEFMTSAQDKLIAYGLCEKWGLLKCNKPGSTI
jgi:hypothetical protein